MVAYILNGELIDPVRFMDNAVDRAWQRMADGLSERYPGSDVTWGCYGFRATIGGERTRPLSYQGVRALLEARSPARS